MFRCYCFLLLLSCQCVYLLSSNLITHTFVVYLLKTPIKTIGKLCNLHFNNNIESRDVNDVKINHDFLHLIGRWRCSADSRKTACKCITASNLAIIHDFSSRFD